MLPDFTGDGYLPAGIHLSTMEEFEKRFVYFERSDRRHRLFDKLRTLYREAIQSGIVNRLLVGGSFITNKAEPNDFDCILVIDRSVTGHDLRPMEYNLVARHRARRVLAVTLFQ